VISLTRSSSQYRGRARAPTVPAVAVAAGFRSAPLRNMVALGAVTSKSARVWLRSEHPGRVRVEYWPARNPTHRRHATLDIGSDATRDRIGWLLLPSPEDDDDLSPGTRYAFSALHLGTGETLGEGGFETAPVTAAAAQDAFSLAIMSCHQPFDGKGRTRPAATAMLQAAAACFERSATKRVIMMGDQMYTDYPPRLSLFDADYFPRVSPDPRYEGVEDCTAAEVRELLVQRYRHYWNVPGWPELHARYPCYPILDDHELVDNWGCDPAHETRRWENYWQGAKAAYFDYQGSRVNEPSTASTAFDYELEYGPVAVYVLDARSNRRTGARPRVYTKAQLLKFSRFLARHADKQVLMLVLSVPAIHLPRWGAQLGHFLTPFPDEDFADRWSTAGHIKDRDCLLRRLHDHQRDHPEQRIALLSGDIHIACAHEIVWDDGTRPLLQFVASGITHRVGALTQNVSKLSILANRRLKLADGSLAADVRRLPSTARSHNPYTKLNFGLLEFRRNSAGGTDLRYSIFGHRGTSPRAEYRSVWR
jgi:alkaline phosphatase D